MARHKMTVTEDPESSGRKKIISKVYIFLTVITILIVIAVAAYFIVVSKKSSSSEALVPPDPEVEPPPSPSHYHIFKKGAVCTDGPPCSAIGKDILAKNGSAVDAAIAALFCNGLVNIQSMGLGGGFMMTVYSRATKTAITLNAREKAPLNATTDMFKSNQEASKKGPLAIGVPGELRGYWTAHKRFGVLPWKTLVEPTLELCANGFNMSKALWDGVSTSVYIQNNPYLREMFYDETNKQLRKGGTLIMPSKTLCNTLKIIADKGGDELYNGSLADAFANDLKQLGSIITKEDLNKYEAKWQNPITVNISNNDILFSVQPPGSGAVLGFILQILKGYKFTNESIHGINNTVLTYHRIIEAYKYAYAKRSLLGDVDFVDVQKVLADLTSPQYAEQIRLQINDSTTYTNASHYGAHFYNQQEHGTAHISILAPNGDAVSVTSSVNFYFGSGLSGNSTGILFNNVMDDFSSPGFQNYFGLPGSPSNEIKPGKRPLSSVSPSVMVDANGDVKMVIGASGGTKITTSVAMVIMRNMWFKQTIKQSVDAPRIHHQLYPMEIGYEYGNLKQVIDGLHELGHKTARYKDRGSIICALFKNQTGIYANSDYRKGGDVYGLD